MTGFCRTKERGKRASLQHQQSSTDGGLEDRPPSMTLSVGGSVGGGASGESPTLSGSSSPMHCPQLPFGSRDAEKLKKVILELVETERAYVKVCSSSS